MFAVQTWESATGRIPKRQVYGNRFLYVQDFWTNGPFGDLVALSLIDAAIAMGFARHGFELWMVSALPLGSIGTFWFWRGATKQGRKTPDAGYVKQGGQWVPTATGKVHLAYFFLQAGAAVFALELIFAGRMNGVPLGLGLAGAFLYGVATLVDLKRGVLSA